jgi:hypothetical protein
MGALEYVRMLSAAMRTLSVAMLIVWPCGSWAQERATKIHVVFQNYYERVRPGYAAGTVNEEMTLILSGKNSVQEVYTSSNKLASESWNTSAALGAGRWSVAGPNRLVRVQRRSQSVRTDVIEVNGSTCKASAKYELLPGFSEYEIYSIVLHGPAYYKQARMVSSTCEIASN